MRLKKVSPLSARLLWSAAFLCLINDSLPGLISPPATAQEARLPTTAVERATDKEHMLQIWKAVMAYVKDKGMTPDYLSDLVPTYLSEAAILLSPVSERAGTATGNNGLEDPALPCSYCYEFSGRKFFNSPLTFRELKQAQMQEFGEVVPILRCFHHNRVLNVSYSGEFYESELYWERSPEALNIIKKIGLGPGFKEGDFVALKVVDAETKKPLAEASVSLTNRVFHYLPLPDRTLPTDGDGLAQIPFGNVDAPGRTLRVTVNAKGYEAATEAWTTTVIGDDHTIALQRKSAP